MKNSILLISAMIAAVPSAFAQMPTPPSPPSSPAIVSTPVVPVVAPVPATNPLEALTWDGTKKDFNPVPGQATADFIFGVTNNTDSPIVIDHVQTSCGCTVAKLPSQPWTIAPQAGGNISASVNLAGKSGTFYKTLTVFNTNPAWTKTLTLMVAMPAAGLSPVMEREKNQLLAKADPQAVFKGDCAKCHADPVHNSMGKELYVKACGICHEAHSRATMVPDLRALNHPADLAFWKLIIANGKPTTAMPAFSNEHGGPLTQEQIDSLAELLVREFPQMYGVPPKTGVSPMPIPPAPTHN